MYINRILEQELLKASNEYPVIMLCGPRQVGKSTMLNHIKEPDRRYVSLDDITSRRLAEKDPDLFFETYGQRLLIDEFQRVPSLLLKIKDIIDKKTYQDQSVNGMFWLTGSQRFPMMKGASESLAGRVAVFEMSALSQREIDGRAGVLFNPDVTMLKKQSSLSHSWSLAETYSRIYRGGMPKIIASGADRERYYENYVSTYLEMDIRNLEQVGKLNEFYDFLVYMAARTAQELHYDSIAKAIGISAPTAKAWVNILEKSGIIFILHPYYSNISNRLVKTPKFYFMDTGLAAYLCRWPNAETLQNGNMDGAFLETFVVGEIVKSRLNAGKSVRDLYYYRDADKREIDLLVVDGGKITPIEVKKSASPSHPDRNFRVLAKFGLATQKGITLCLCDEVVPYNAECYLCPISVI